MIYTSPERSSGWEEGRDGLEYIKGAQKTLTGHSPRLRAVEKFYRNWLYNMELHREFAGNIVRLGYRKHLCLFPELWWALKLHLGVFILDGFVSSL